MISAFLTRGRIPVPDLTVGARQFSLLLLFSLTCAFSSVTLLPGASAYRYPYFERYLDIFYVLMLLLATSSTQAQSRLSSTSIPVFFLILVSGISALGRFGTIYFFVEYRQYILIGASLLFLKLTSSRFDAERIAATFPIYVAALLMNFVLANLFGEYYRPGVFGESNYDLAYVSVVLAALLTLKGNSYNYLMPLLLFALISQSRTAVGVVMVLGLLRASSLKGILFLVVAFPVAFLLLQSRLWSADAAGMELLEQLDRVQMLMAYTEAVAENTWLAIVGQSISGITFKADVLSFYLETQAASAALDFNTPSNFHGHLLRGFLLLGIPLYIVFIWYVLCRIRHVHERSVFVILASVIAVTSLTQSIFAHPFAGTMFAVVSIMGFSKTNINRASRAQS